jgi:hypothetical protein
MAKKVELHIEIDKNGKIHVKPEGTEGPECLELMAFLDTIPGFNVIETKKEDDFYKKTSLNSKVNSKTSN